MAAEVSNTFSEALFTFAEQKGTYTRVDWHSSKWDVAPWSHTLLPDSLNDTIKATPWRTVREYDYTRLHHVNIQEAKAVNQTLKFHVHSTLEARRVVNGTDSRVCLGAFGKGRSASRRLNNVLRGSLGWQILGQKDLHQFYIHTDANPADDPSRHKPLRAPEPIASDLAHLVLPDRTPSGKSTKGPHGDRNYNKKLKTSMSVMPMVILF